GAGRVEGNDVVLDLDTELPAGDLEVRWRVGSSDGHPIEGASPLTLDLPEPVATTEPASSPAEPASSAGEPGATAEPATVTAEDLEVRWRVATSDGHPTEGVIPFTLDLPEPVATTEPTSSPAEPASSPAEPGATAEPATVTAEAPTAEDAAADDAADQEGPGGLPTWLKVAIGIAALAAVVGPVVIVARRLRSERDVGGCSPPAAVRTARRPAEIRAGSRLAGPRRCRDIPVPAAGCRFTVCVMTRRLILPAVLLLGLAGCSSSTSDDTSAPEETAAQSP